MKQNNQKAIWRQKFLEQWNSITEDQGIQAQVVDNLLTALTPQKAGAIWCGYKSFSQEFNLDVVWSKSSHLCWAFPCMRGDHIEMLIPASLEEAAFRKSRWGILEPLEGQVVQPQEIQGLIIPGLGFDRRGFRLGRGKGFYDRFLANSESRKIGVAFSKVFVDQLPADSWDIPMDQVATEQGLCLCQLERRRN